MKENEYSPGAKDTLTRPSFAGGGCNVWLQRKRRWVLPGRSALFVRVNIRRTAYTIGGSNMASFV